MILKKLFRLINYLITAITTKLKEAIASKQEQPPSQNSPETLDFHNFNNLNKRSTVSPEHR